MKELKVLGISDSTKRAMRMSRQALVDQGYELVDVEFTEKEIDDSFKYFYNTLVNELAPQVLLDFVSEAETLDRGTKEFMRIVESGPFMKKVFAWLARKTNQGRVANLIPHYNLQTGTQREHFNEERYKFCHKMVEKWQSFNIEAMLAPVFPHCAFSDKNAGDMATMTHYCLIWNILNFPTGSVPVTTVREEEQTFTDSYNDKWTEMIRETCESSAGMPIGV